MKIKSGYVVRELAGKIIVVPTGETAVNFNGIITLNNSGKLLFNALQEETTKEELVLLFLEHYEVTRDLALADINKFIEILESNNILE